MYLGVTIRNMGVQSTPDIIAACAKSAEAAGMESAWIVDHIAIPPDDAEGSGGRYMDPLVTLAWLAAATRTIKLGTAVLILPYRPALPAAKQIASIQELSGERLIVGAGIGWMDPEFKALGIDRHQRGRISDATLQVINDCFANDTVTLNGQTFLFKPRPAKPPIYIGGAAPHALRRAARYGDGWLPMGADPAKLPAQMQLYKEFCDEAGRPMGKVTVMGGLPADADAAQARFDAFREVGVERFVCGMRYDDHAEYIEQLERLVKIQRA